MTDDEILSAIRAKSFASAKREINSKILRFPQKNYYRALDAFYLLNTGDTKGALDECNKTKAKIPSDPATLDLLYETYSKLGRRSEAQSVYETAVKKYPSPELILIWYNKAVQMFDAQMMQKSAAALRKSASSSRAYQLKSVFADFIWGSETKSEKESQMLLDSASKTMEKLQPLQTNQEVFLFATVLMKKQDFIQVANILEPVKSKELELIILFLEALDKSQNWVKLYQYAHSLLFDQSFNDYDTWKYLIKAGHALNKPQEELSSLIKFDTRNSLVANLEISRVYGSNIEQAVDAYFKVYQTKACCSADLAAFELPDAFKDKIMAQKSALLQKPQLSDEEVALCINIEKLLSKLGPHQIEWESFAKYDNPGLGDLYLASMIQSFGRDLSTTRVLEHIVKLEKFCELDPNNFNIKLWLLNLYSTISGSSMALETYESLKIKMIQHDIMAYKLNLEPSIRNLNQLIQIFRFYLTAEREITAYFGVALERGLYTKLEDLYRFGKRLTSSISKHLLTLQISKMCRMLNNDYASYFQGILNDTKAQVLSDSFAVFDNRDFETDYKLGFEFDSRVMFNSEAKKSKEYVQLYSVKELLIAENHEGEVEKLLKLFEKWLSNPKFTETLSPSEMHFLKIFLAIFKLTKVSQSKDKVSQMNYLTKHLDFKNTIENYLAKTSPLSSTANRILVDSLELVKVISMLSNDESLSALGKRYQQGLVKYVVTNPEISYFKEVKSNLDYGNLSKSFVETQLERLEDGIRASKFKLK
ncbi:hypothetical protein JCM33374_g506 [Metschnikowia sp. JCM 33374]|nr:hypothetical protein JCM33374_g506 [Metschnikowia sp. JCM 33374]